MIGILEELHIWKFGINAILFTGGRPQIEPLWLSYQPGAVSTNNKGQSGKKSNVT